MVRLNCALARCLSSSNNPYAIVYFCLKINVCFISKPFMLQSFPKMCNCTKTCINFCFCNGITTKTMETLQKLFGNDTLSKTFLSGTKCSRKASYVLMINHTLVDHPLQLMSNTSLKSDIWCSTSFINSLSEKLFIMLLLVKNSTNTVSKTLLKH